MSFNQSFGIGILAFAFVMLVGCGTARTIVLEPIKKDGASIKKYSQIKISADNHRVLVPADIKKTLHQVLKQGLIKAGIFSKDGDLTLDYTFVSYDSGNRFARFFWEGLGNAGEGSMVIRVKYFDGQGAQITEIETEGRIGSGFFGGSLHDAALRAADDIVDFTIKNFKR